MFSISDIFIYTGTITWSSQFPLVLFCLAITFRAIAKHSLVTHITYCISWNGNTSWRYREKNLSLIKSLNVAPSCLLKNTFGTELFFWRYGGTVDGQNISQSPSHSDYLHWAGQTSSNNIWSITFPPSFLEMLTNLNLLLTTSYRLLRSNRAPADSFTHS